MGGGGGGSVAQPINFPDSIRTNAIIEVVDIWGVGEIEGFPSGVNPLERVYLDGTPVMSNGQLNFKGVTFSYRLGTQTQSYIPGIVDDTVGAPVAVNVPIVKSTPQTFTINDTSTDAVRIIISFPNGLFMTHKASGNVTGTFLDLKIEVKANSGAWSMIDLGGRGTVFDKAEGPFQRSYTINLRAVHATASTYQVRVTRISDDPETQPNTLFDIVNHIRLDSYVKLTYAKLRRPNVAYCRLTFEAKYFSHVPVRSYLLRGWKIQVPGAGVYDPVNRTYTGAVWNGTFVKRWCRNPAWFLYHLLTTAGSGLGEDINPIYQDKWSIFTIAKRCDELVPNGKGGTEPRYSIDAWFMEQTSAHEMIQQLAGAFDAMALWDGKAIFVTQDAPKPVTGLYLPANVINGRFVYAGSGRQVRYTTAYIQYNDPDDEYRLSVEPVEDLEGIDRYGYRPKVEVAIGCISRAQAHRRGKRLLVTAREEIDTVSFSTSLAGLANKPGDVVRLADPLRASGNRYGGRLLAGSTINLAVLDAPVTLAGLTSYRIAIIDTDGSINDVGVTNGAGTHATITPSDPFYHTPQAGIEWIVYNPLAIGQTFRILSIAENDDPDKNGYFTISATQYAAGKYAQIDDVADLPVRPDNPYIVSGVIPPSGVTVNEGVYVGLEGIRRFLDVSWTASDDKLLRGYIIIVRHEGTEIIRQEITGVSYRIENPMVGTYEITLAAINLAGKLSSSITVEHVLGDFYLISAIQIVGLTLIPSHTNEFEGRDAFMDWDTNAAQVLAFTDSYATGPGGSSPWFRDFEIRIFDGSTLVGTHYCTESSFKYTFEMNIADGGPRRTFTAKVRARDYYGRYSQESFLVCTNPPSVDFGAITLTQGPSMIFVNYTKPTDPDYQRTRLFASQSQGFAPNPATNMVGETTDRVTSFPIAAPGWWYMKLQGIDAFGPDGAPYSNEFSLYVTTSSIDVSAAVNQILEDPGRTGDVVVETNRFLVVQPGTGTPQKATFGVGYVDGIPSVGIKGDLVLDGTMYGRSIIAHSIAADKLNVNYLSAVSADLGVVTAGTLKTSTGTGWRVELSDVGNFPIWYGTGTKNDVNGKFFLDNAGNAFFGGAISVNSKFLVSADGTVTVKNSANQVVFSTGTGANWTYIDNKPDSLFDINTIEFTKLQSIEDGATKNAVYRQGGTVPTGQNGDIWYVTTTTAGYEVGATYLYTTAWNKVADITGTQLSGSGVNICNPRYATFEESGLPPVSGSALGNTSIDNGASYIGRKSIKIAVPTSTTDFIRLGSSALDYNFAITPNKKWILSFFVKSSVPSASVHVRLRLSSGSGINVSGLTSDISAAWSRIYGVVDLTSNSSNRAQIELSNNSHAVTACDVWFDGIMVEAQIGDKTTPSVYHEPPNFLTTYIGELDANKSFVYRQNSAPTGGTYTVNDLWFDTDSDPKTLYQWSGSSWVVVSNLIDDTDQINDGAGLGNTAQWLQVTGRPTSLADLDSAQATALSNALLAIDDMSQDSKISSNEKIALLREWEVAVAEKDLLEAQATAFAIVAEKTAFTNAILALRNMLNRTPSGTWSTATPVLLGANVTYGIAKTTALSALNPALTAVQFRALFSTYYSAKIALLNKIADVASLSALWDNITGTDKPSAKANRIFTQSTAPVNPADKITTGDLWIDTRVLNTTNGTGGNRIWRWSGSAWQVYQDAQISQAAINASAAITAVNEIALDNILSPVEKSAIRKEWDAIISEKPIIDAQAATYFQNGTVNGKKSDWQLAILNLGTYLNNGTVWLFGNATPAWINDASLGTSTNLPGSTPGLTFRSWFNLFYDARVGLIQAITDAAFTNNTNTKSIADAAKAVTDDIVSDLKFSPAEKKIKRIEWEQIASERDGMSAQATLLSITTELTSYVNAWQLLANNLNAGVTWAPTVGGVWTSPIPTQIDDAGILTTTTFTTTSKNTFRTRYNNFYNARMALQNKISDQASKLADWNNIISKPSTFLTSGELSSLNQATLDASNAMLAVDVMSNDAKFSPVEKKRIRYEWDAIITERGLLNTQATNYGIINERDAYLLAVNDLRHYLNGQTGTATTWVATIPLWIGTNATQGISKATDIDAATFRLKFKNYYDAKITLLNKFPDLAVTNASLAVNAVSEMADDAKFSPVEKKRVRTEWDAIISEKTILEAQATVYSVSSTAYSDAANFLRRYLNNTTTGAWTTAIPLWISTDSVNGITKTTTIQDTTIFRAKFTDYYNAKVSLVKAITDAAKTDINQASQTALWTGISGVPYETILNNDDSAALGFNPTFANWSGTYPDGWINSNGGAPIKETAIVQIGYPYAVRYNAAGINIGMSRQVTVTLPIGTFISGSVDVYLVSRTSGLPGISIQLFTNAGLTTDVVTRAQPYSTSTGVWQRVPFLARVNAGQQIFGIKVSLFGSLSAYASGPFTGSVLFSNLRFALFDASLDNTTISLIKDVNNVYTITGAGGGVPISITGLGYNGDLNATRGAPNGTYVGGFLAENIAQAATDFNAANNRNGAAITAPTLATDLSCIDHSISTDGSANLSFEWSWSGNAGDIDGFIVHLAGRTQSTPFVITGVANVGDTAFSVPAYKRAFVVYGVPANRYYTFAVRAYRKVDKSINASGIITSAIVQSLVAGEHPYQPSANIAFQGDVTGTISGDPASQVVRPNNPIKGGVGGNVSTYILNAAIDTAQINALAVKTANIDNLAVTNGKINNLAVDTLKIGDNAVTVPSGASSSNGNAVVTENTGGYPTMIMGSMTIINSTASGVTVSLKIDGADYMGTWVDPGQRETVSLMFRATSSAGNHNYAIACTNQSVAYNGSILVLGIKK